MILLQFILLFPLLLSSFFFFFFFPIFIDHLFIRLELQLFVPSGHLGLEHVVVEEGF
jgi:hypothetical protein